MNSLPLLSKRSSSIVNAMRLTRRQLLAHARDTAGATDEQFPAAFNRLVAAVEAAFRNEETLMESAGWPDVHAQRQDNAVLLMALHGAGSQVEAGGLAVGREVVAVLPDLLSLHRFCALRVLEPPLSRRRGGPLRRMRRSGHEAPRRAAGEAR